MPTFFYYRGGTGKHAGDNQVLNWGGHLYSVIIGGMVLCFISNESNIASSANNSGYQAKRKMGGVMMTVEAFSNLQMVHDLPVVCFYLALGALSALALCGWQGNRLYRGRLQAACRRWTEYFAFTVTSNQIVSIKLKEGIQEVPSSAMNSNGRPKKRTSTWFSSSHRRNLCWSSPGAA